MIYHFDCCRMTRMSLVLVLSMTISQIVAADNPLDSIFTVQWETMDRLSYFRLNELKQQIAGIDHQIYEVSHMLNNADTASDLDGQYLHAIIRKQQLADQKEQLHATLLAFQTNIRYRKGLEVIKLLYEKVLALDHHFTSLQTQQHIMALSNPNSFPEFKACKEKLQQKLKKENTIEMPPLLQANPYFSAAYMLVTSFVSIGDSKQKEKELEDIACILDFTMQMHADLNIVYFETQYLNESNRILREECATLYAEYVKPLGYYTSLDVCRKQDDWENVYAAIERYMRNMETAIAAPDENSQKSAYRYQVDLDFSIDRLLDFINKYEAFVSQGLKYYQKFQVIVNSYANEQVCANQLPLQFANLKMEISTSIEKFDASYSLPEIKGSRLKDLLYGID